MESKKGLLAYLFIATLLTAICLNAIAFKLISVGVWLYKPMNSFSRWWMPGIVFVFSVMVVWFGLIAIEKNDLKKLKLSIASLSICQFAFALSVTFLSVLTWMLLAWLVINPASNSYFSTAVETKSLMTLIKDFDAKMPNRIQDAFGKEWEIRDDKANEPALISHSATQSPGPVVFNGIIRKVVLSFPPFISVAEEVLNLFTPFSTEQISDAMRRWHNVKVNSDDVSAALWCSLIYIAFGCLTVYALLGIGQRLGNLRVGFVSASLFSVLPSFHLFTPSVDQIYPLVTAILIWLLISGFDLKIGSLWTWFYFLGAGFILAIGVFLNLGLVSLLPFCILFIALMAYRLSSHRRLAIYALVVFIVSFLTPLLLLEIVFGCNLWAVFKKSDMLRYQLYTEYTPRPYLPWLWMNLLDFFVFVGMPVTLAFFFQIFLELKSAISQRSFSSISPLLWAFLLNFLMLIVSGKVRGESARMWLFLTPLIIIPSAMALENLGVFQNKFGAAFVLALQALTTVVLREFLRVWGI